MNPVRNVDWRLVGVAAVVETAAIAVPLRLVDSSGAVALGDPSVVLAVFGPLVGGLLVGVRSGGGIVAAVRNGFFTGFETATLLYVLLAVVLTDGFTRLPETQLTPSSWVLLAVPLVAVNVLLAVAVDRLWPGGDGSSSPAAAG